jgi:hypothetical protein
VALEEIVGERPYPESARGDLNRITEYWLLWFDRQQ